MLTIRLSRLGRNKKYAYRLVLQDHRCSVKGEAIEILGNYQPAMPQKPLVLNKDRITYWLSKGARPSDSTAVLLKKEGFPGMERFIEPRDKKRAPKAEQKTEAKEAPAKEASKTTPVAPAAPAAEKTEKTEKAEAAAPAPK